MAALLPSLLLQTSGIYLEIQPLMQHQTAGPRTEEPRTAPERVVDDNGLFVPEADPGQTQREGMGDSGQQARSVSSSTPAERERRKRGMLERKKRGGARLERERLEKGKLGRERLERATGRERLEREWLERERLERERSDREITINIFR
jgi:hypothetical protein